MTTYKHAELILAEMHGALVSSASLKTFRARLKHLKKLGVPSGSRKGRGKKIDYSEDQILEWVFCLEMAEFGIDPTVIVKTLKRERDKILKSLSLFAPSMMVIRPAVMNAAWSKSPALEMTFVDWESGSEYQMTGHRAATIYSYKLRRLYENVKQDIECLN